MNKNTTTKKNTIILSEKNKSILKEIDSKLKELNDQFGILSANKQNILIAIINEKSNLECKFKLDENYNLIEAIEDTPEKSDPGKNK